MAKSQQPGSDMPLEDKIDLLVKEFGTFGTKLDTLDSKVDTLDSRVGTLESKVGTLSSDVGSLKTEVSSLSSQVNRIDSNVTVMDRKLDKLQIRMDETHQLAKLGLEAVEGLRESTDDRFADMTRQNAEQTDLLKSVLVHVRKRVERIEHVQRPKRRRRS
jgi:chromosome segregation ATPase